jgi:hypothetical protein
MMGQIEGVIGRVPIRGAQGYFASMFLIMYTLRLPPRLCVAERHFWARFGPGEEFGSPVDYRPEVIVTMVESRFLGKL